MAYAVEYRVDKPWMRLSALRERKAMTQVQLAEASGIRQTTISAIELGKQQPRSSTLRLLAQGLGVPFDDLVAYMEGRKRIRVSHVLGEAPESWIDRNPELLGRAVRCLTRFEEDWVEEFVAGAEGGGAQSRSGHRPEGGPASPGRRSRRDHGAA